MSLSDKINKISSKTRSNWLEKSGEQIAKTKSRKNARKVALRVLQILKDQGISQTDLAARMNVSRQRVADIVKGKENFTFETIDKLESALGVTLMTITSPSKDLVTMATMSGSFSVPFSSFVINKETTSNWLGELFNDNVMTFTPIVNDNRLNNLSSWSLFPKTLNFDPVRRAMAQLSSKSWNQARYSSVVKIVYYGGGQKEVYNKSDRESNVLEY